MDNMPTEHASPVSSPQKASPETVKMQPLVAGANLTRNLLAKHSNKSLLDMQTSISNAKLQAATREQTRLRKTSLTATASTTATRRRPMTESDVLSILGDTHSAASSSSVTLPRRPRTFYEEFKASFPEFVRQNEDTAKRQSTLFPEAKLDIPPSSKKPSPTSNSPETLSQELTAKTLEKQNLIDREHEYLDELDDLDSRIRDLLSQRDYVSSQLDLVRDMRADLDSELESLEERISDAEDQESLDDHVTSILYLKVDQKELNASDVCIKTLVGHNAPVNCVDFNSPHDTLVSGSEDGLLKIWDLGSFRCVGSYALHDGAVKAAQYSDDILVTGGTDSKLTVNKIGSVAQGTLHFDAEHASSLSGHYGAINCLQFSVHDNRLISGSADNTIKIWDLARGECIGSMQNGSSEHDLFMNDGPERRFKPIGLASLASFSENSRGVGALQFYRHAMATGGHDGIIRLWDLRMAESHFESKDSLASCRRTLAGHTLPVTCLQFDDYNLVSGSLDKTIRVWDLRNGGVVEGFMSPSINGINSIQFDEDKILAAAGDKTISVFDRRSHLQRQLEGHMAPVRSIRYIDRVLASGGEDACVKIWNL